MSYLSSEPNELGYFGCGGDCSCKSCRTAAPNFSEVYEEEEPEAPPPAAKLSGWYGEPPPLLRPGPQLRLPPFEVLTGYGAGQWRLSPAQLAQVQRLAEHIVRTWTTGSPVTGVRLIGFAESAEAPAALQRAVAARAALNDAISRLNPGVLRGIQFNAEEGDLQANPGTDARRVDILLWIGLGAPFTPPPPPSTWGVPRTMTDRPVRLPTPEEAARRVFRPETPEDRINRILRTLPPAPPPRRSFNQMFWRQVDERLDSVMSRAGVPQSLRGHIRSGAHAAITHGAEAIFDQVLDAAGMTGAPREAVKASVRAAMETPVR